MPKAEPVTTPLEEPTAATNVLLLDHVPPAGEQLNVELPPEHIVVLPVIAATGFTFIVFVAVDISPQASVEVTVYVVVAFGIVVGFD